MNVLCVMVNKKIQKIKSDFYAMCTCKPVALHTMSSIVSPYYENNYLKLYYLRVSY